MTDTRDRLAEAAIPHIPFDGMNMASLRAAARDLGLSEDVAIAFFPGGGADLAAWIHKRGDESLALWLADTPPEGRFRDRIAAAVMARLDLVTDKELVRRGTAFFALPHNAPEGAKAIWATADAIWTALGDTSDDLNWYSKRATLSAVYTATVVFWLGDDSPDHHATWEFLDRRIDNVMQVEKLKASARNNPLSKAILAGPLRFLGQIKAPVTPDDLPGTVKNRQS